MMIKYVCGFLFDKEVQNVILIEKQKPDWQKGKLNGVGGKVEGKEPRIEAMRREFQEETGLFHEKWIRFCEISGTDWLVTFYYGIDDKNQFLYAETKEAEEVCLIEIDSLDQFDCISNLQWLIPLALYKNRTPDEIVEFP